MVLSDHPGKLADGEDRFGTPMQFLNGRFDIKVSAADTGGALCIIDTLRDHVGGPPLHYHEHQDEWFLVREGSFLFRIGDKFHRAGPGDSIFGPRRMPHTFRYLTAPVRLLPVSQPALRIEEFFAAGTRLEQAETAAFRALSLAHGIVNIGPTLRSDETVEG
ncbi:hypothetical protein ACO34A_04660 [Rhizobium sp. ACO-34A]|nr:cupin domain-containing protein [Rhizobium sp. ACO-34A]ATN33093.1 hypothetical protein ACO34A_04660 [Rhizobium sp. ACO-34A]